jgi:DNA-binding CsgD family transcriptional regulator
LTPNGVRTDAVTDTTTRFPARRQRGESAAQIAEGAGRLTRALALDAGSSALVVALLMFAGIFALCLSVSTSDATGLFILFVVPIATVTLARGSAAGAASAILAVALVYLRADLQQVEMSALGYGMRALTFFGIPLVIWLARQDAERERNEPLATPAGAQRAEPSRSAEAGHKHLTRRELDVLRLLATGRTNAEIAEQLVVSVRTVESHRASLRRKLGRPSHSELCRHALERGLLPGDIAR